MALEGKYKCPLKWTSATYESYDYKCYKQLVGYFGK